MGTTEMAIKYSPHLLAAYTSSDFIDALLAHAAFSGNLSLYLTEYVCLSVCDLAYIQGIFTTF